MKTKIYGVFVPGYSIPEVTIAARTKKEAGLAWKTIEAKHQVYMPLCKVSLRAMSSIKEG